MAGIPTLPIFPGVSDFSCILPVSRFLVSSKIEVQGFRFKLYKKTVGLRDKCENK